MKLSTSVAITVLAAIDCVYGFKNTAPALFQIDSSSSSSSSKTHQVSGGSSVLQRYSESFESYGNEITENFCSVEENPNHMFIFQVKGLNKDTLHQCDNIKQQMRQNQESVSFTPHVLYLEDDNIESFISKSCVVKKIKVEDEDSWIEEYQEIKFHEQVVIFEIAKDAQLLDTVFEKLTLVKEDLSNYIIQGLPTFKSPEIKADSIINKASQFLGFQKREENEDDTVDAEDFEAIEKELKEAFKEVDAMIDDELVSIYSDDESKASTYNFATSASSNNTETADGSLFDNYGFFSTGIWMGTIVSLFLVYVLVTALGWLGSLQISYKAFEKAPNGQKKTQ